MELEGFEDLDSVLGEVDVAFVIDSTSSMLGLIQSAKDEAVRQAQEIAAKGDLSLRLALVEYRDHPPQDHSFVTRKVPFSDFEIFQTGLNRMKAEGGGDRDEAVYDGLLVAGLELDWRSNSDKLIFLIGDSPPHNPCLCKATPNGVVEVLGSKGITLHALSIAGYPATTAAFKEMTDALRGVTREAEAATYSKFTGVVLDSHSEMVSDAREFTHTARVMYSSAGGMSVSSGAVGASLGYSESETAGMMNYLAKRGIDISSTISDEKVAEKLNPKTKKPRAKKGS